VTTQVKFPLEFDEHVDGAVVLANVNEMVAEASNPLPFAVVVLPTGPWTG
jgi:hypothetical protein